MDVPNRFRPYQISNVCCVLTCSGSSVLALIELHIWIENLVFPLLPCCEDTKCHFLSSFLVCLVVNSVFQYLCQDRVKNRWLQMPNIRGLSLEKRKPWETYGFKTQEGEVAWHCFVYRQQWNRVGRSQKASWAAGSTLGWSQEPGWIIFVT